MLVWKDENKRKGGHGWPIFLKKNHWKLDPGGGFVVSVFASWLRVWLPQSEEGKIGKIIE